MLHVSVLGEQAITDDEAGVHVHSSHAVALVAFLAAHAGAPQPRPRIAGMFWPGSTDAQALTNLRRLPTIADKCAVWAVRDNPGFWFMTKPLPDLSWIPGACAEHRADA